MNKTCANCKHWHGDDSSYRAKCEANSGVDTISTAFDDTCALWERDVVVVHGVTTTAGSQPYTYSYTRSAKKDGKP